MVGRCQGRVWDGWHRTSCGRKGTVERAGKCYCWQHDPERIAKKSAERSAKFDKEWAEREAEWAATDRRNALLGRAGLDALTDDDLEEIIALGGIKILIAIANAGSESP